LSAGISTLMTTEIAATRRLEATDEKRIASLGIVLTSSLGLIGAAALVFSRAQVSFALSSGFELMRPLALFSPILFLLPVGSVAIGILQGQQRFSVTATIWVIKAGVVALSSGVFAYYWGLPGACLSLALGSAVFAISAMISVRNSVSLPVAIFEDRNLPLFAFTLPLVIQTVVLSAADWVTQAQVASSSDGWLAVADLGVARQMAMILPLVSGAAATAALPNLAGVKAGVRDTETHVENVTGYLRITLLTQIPLAVLLVLFSPVLVAVFYGDKMQSSVDILRILAISYAIFGIVWTAGPVLTSSGRTKQLLVLNLIRACAIILFAHMFIGVHGVIGVAYGYLCAELVTASIITIKFHTFVWRVAKKSRRILIALAPLSLGVLLTVVVVREYATWVSLAGVCISLRMLWQGCTGEEKTFLIKKLRRVFLLGRPTG
jgi:O-antigen/teichoic acid export membrane protein